MPIQTSYGYSYGGLLKGTAINQGNVFQDISAYAAAALDFGMGVVYDAAVTDNSPKVKVPTATGGKFIGIVKLVQKQPTGEAPFLTTITDTTTVTQYAIGDSVTIRTRGRILVYTEQAVEPSDAVFLRHTANTGVVPGNFRKDADTNRADAVSNARWVTKTSGAGLAVLELN